MQRYVSTELSHFVGRGQAEEQQFKLLLDILRTGWLTYAPHDPTQPRMARLDFSRPISTDEAIKYQVVCFCDIPDTDLAIHVKKYSKFGLAFKKTFLIARGACPVFYVANETPVPTSQVFSPDDFLDRIKAARQNGFVDNPAILHAFCQRGGRCRDQVEDAPPAKPSRSLTPTNP